MIVGPAVRELRLHEDGSPTAFPLVGASEVTTVTADAFAGWRAGARWWSLEQPGGSRVRLWTSWPHAVLESRHQGVQGLVLAPISSGPGLFFATVQVTSIEPTRLDHEGDADLVDAARRWAVEGHLPAADLRLLRWEHGRHGEVLRTAVWLGAGPSWFTAAVEDAWSDDGNAGAGPDDEPPADLEANTGEPMGPSIAYQPLHLGALAAELSLAMASDAIELADAATAS